MMKNHTKKLMIGIVALGVGGAAFGETFLGTGLAIGLQRRLLLKLAESLVDAVTRKTVELASAPAAYEAYDLRGRPCYYEDTVSGTYRGSPMAQVFRRMWLDPVTGTQYFGTWMNGTWQDNRPFYYNLEKRNYRCYVPGPAGYDLNLRADVRYWIENVVTRTDLAHAVWSHPVHWQFGMHLMPQDCQTTPPSIGVIEDGYSNLARGGRDTVSPALPNVEVQYCLVGYDEK